MNIPGFHLQDILNNPILGTGLIMTLAGGAVYTLREIPKKIFQQAKSKVVSRLIYTVQIYDYDDLFDLFEKWLFVNYPKRYRDVQANISYRCSGLEPSNETSRKIPTIQYRQAPTMFTLKHKGKTIFVTKQDEKLEHATSFSSLYSYKYVLKGFHCRGEINELLQSIVNEHFAHLNENTIRVRPNDDYGNWLSGNNISVKAIDKIIISHELKSELIADINKFAKSKDWYTNTGIPYKRTYCFHGRPGTGKTSLSLAIASYTGRDVYLLNLSALRNDSAMQSAFSQLGPNAILLIEDIDAAFAKRDSTKENISFSCLLNCTDGALYKEGIIICLTTNHLDKLDPALLREGRTDLIRKIDYPAIEQIEEFLTVFYEQPISLDCACDNLWLPMSAIQEICITNRDAPSNAVEQIKSQLLKTQPSLS